VALRAPRVTVSPSPLIDIADGFEAYQETLRAKSPQFCKDLARKTRKLELKPVSFVSSLTQRIRRNCVP